MVDEAEIWRGVAIDERLVALKFGLWNLRKCFERLDVKCQEDEDVLGKCPTGPRGPMEVLKATMVPINCGRAFLLGQGDFDFSLGPRAGRRRKDFVGLVMEVSERPIISFHVCFSGATPFQKEEG